MVSQVISLLGKLTFKESQALLQISVAKIVSNPAFSKPKSICCGYFDLINTYFYTRVTIFWVDLTNIMSKTKSLHPTGKDGVILPNNEAFVAWYGLTGSASVFKIIKSIFGILRPSSDLFKIMQIDIFWGNLTDVTAKRNATDDR